MTEADFLRCCGSKEWARRMALAQGDLFTAADEIWWSLTPEDWLEAFRAHPKIGATSNSKWSGQEQAAARDASPHVLSDLKEANEQYERRFGYIFIVRATGKTAEEMLALLHQRLNNSPEVELRIAAEQQRQITRLRLEKLLQEK